MPLHISVIRNSAVSPWRARSTRRRRSWWRRGGADYRISRTPDSVRRGTNVSPSTGSSGRIEISPGGKYTTKDALATFFAVSIYNFSYVSARGARHVRRTCPKTHPLAPEAISQSWNAAWTTWYDVNSLEIITARNYNNILLRILNAFLDATITHPRPVVPVGRSKQDVWPLNCVLPRVEASPRRRSR